MHNFRVTILGSSAATPTSVRHTTAQLLQYHNKRFLLDCAEGTQMQLRNYKIPMMGINHIFISHLHGDHYLGLPGLLFSLHLLGRTKQLHVYSPPGLQDIIDLQFKISGLNPQYETIFHEINSGRSIIYEDDHLCVETMEMMHRIPCYGFLFSEKPIAKNIRKEVINKYNIPVTEIPSIKKGAGYETSDGVFIPNDQLTLPESLPRKYAFCSDTQYTEAFLDQIMHADLLYHEATFLQDKADIAKEKTHTTTAEAATLAKKAKVGKLLLGHYSARYKDLASFVKEASAIFPDCILATEGAIIDVRD